MQLGRHASAEVAVRGRRGTAPLNARGVRQLDANLHRSSGAKTTYYYEGLQLSDRGIGAVLFPSTEKKSSLSDQNTAGRGMWVVGRIAFMVERLV